MQHINNKKTDLNFWLKFRSQWNSRVRTGQQAFDSDHEEIFLFFTTVSPPEVA
jgi:hypothetical protein